MQVELLKMKLLTWFRVVSLPGFSGRAGFGLKFV